MRFPLTRGLFIAIVLGSNVGAQPAKSPPADQSSRAAALLSQGHRQMAEGNHAQALQSYDAAKDVAPLPEADYYAGLALEQLGRGADAVKRYRAYLAATPNAANRDEVESRIERLEKQAGVSPSAPVVPSAAPTLPAETPPWVKHPATGSAPIMYGEDDAPMPQHRYPSGGPLVQKWWFWVTMVGIVGASITAGAVVASSENAD